MLKAPQLKPVKLCASDRDVAGQPYRRVLALNRPAIQNIFAKLGDKATISRLNRNLCRRTTLRCRSNRNREYENAFRGMAGIYFYGMRAALEDNLRQKNILLKEVHPPG